MKPNTDLLSWTLGGLALSLGGLYFFEASQHDTLIEAERQAQLVRSECRPHAVGPAGKTLLLVCDHPQTPQQLPSYFEKLVVRGPQNQTQCQLHEGRAVDCLSASTPQIRADAPTHN